MSREAASRVQAYVRSLEREDRYVVMMYYADQLTAEEIALVLDVSAARVRATLERVAQAIRDLLGRVAVSG